MRCLRSATARRRRTGPSRALRRAFRWPKVSARRSRRWRKLERSHGMLKGWIAALLGCTTMLLCAGALAQKQSDTRWYAGASLGRADLGPDTDTALKIFGGYQINRSFAVEFGYTN